MSQLQNSTSSNVTNNSTLLWPHHHDVASLEIAVLAKLTDSEIVTAYAILAVVCIVGVALNGLAIALTVFTDLRKKHVNIFVCNVAITDFGNCFFMLVFQAYYILNPVEAVTSTLCPLLGFLNFSIGFEEITFIPYICVNRYISLYKGMLYNKIYTQRNIYLMIIASWLFTFALILPYHIGGMTGFDGDNMHCCIKFVKNTFWDAYYLTFTFVPMLFANGIALWATWKVYQKLKNHASSVEGSNIDIKTYREVQKFTLLDIILPMFCLTPYFVVKYAYPDRDGIAIRIFMAILFLLGTVVRGLNILVVLRPYKKAMLKLFGIRNKVESISGGSLQTNSTAKFKSGTFKSSNMRSSKASKASESIDKF